MSIHAELLDAYSEGMLNLGTSALSPDVNVQCNSASGFSSTLVELDLKGNYYTQEVGGRAMAESLRLNTTHTSTPVLRGSSFAGIGWEPKTQTPNPKPQTLMLPLVRGAFWSEYHPKRLSFARLTMLPVHSGIDNLDSLT